MVNQRGLVSLGLIRFRPEFTERYCWRAYVFVLALIFEAAEVGFRLCMRVSGSPTMLRKPFEYVSQLLQ